MSGDEDIVKGGWREEMEDHSLADAQVACSEEQA